MKATTERPTDLLDLTRQWYWPSEVAKICHVSKATVYRWIEEGSIVTILTRRPFKIRREEVERMLSEDGDAHLCLYASALTRYQLYLEVRQPGWLQGQSLTAVRALRHASEQNSFPASMEH